MFAGCALYSLDWDVMWTYLLPAKTVFWAGVVIEFFYSLVHSLESLLLDMLEREDAVCLRVVSSRFTQIELRVRCFISRAQSRLGTLFKRIDRLRDEVTRSLVLTTGHVVFLEFQMIIIFHIFKIVCCLNQTRLCSILRLHVE